MPIGYWDKPNDTVCPQCKKPFLALTRRKYCTQKCRNKTVKLKMWGPNDISRNSPVNGSPIGASAEMLVCFDLLRRGLEPYTPVNGHAHHDIVCSAKEGEKTWRIAVKRGVRMKPKLKTGQHRVAYGGMCHTVHKNSDVLAIAITTDPPSVHYFIPKQGAIYLLDNSIKFWEN